MPHAYALQRIASTENDHFVAWARGLDFVTIPPILNFDKRSLPT